MLNDDVDDDNIVDGIYQLEEKDQFTFFGFSDKNASSQDFYEAIISKFILGADIRVRKWPFLALVSFKLDNRNLVEEPEEPFSYQLAFLSSSIDANFKGAGNPTRTILNSNATDDLESQYDHELLRALMEKTNLYTCFK